MANVPYVYLIQNGGNANGSYPDSLGLETPGSAVMIDAAGTFAGATLGIQVQPVGQTAWLDVAGLALTAAGSQLIRCTPGSRIRAVITGAAAGTQITATASPYLGGV